LSDRFKVKPEELPERITGLQNELRTTQKQLKPQCATALAKSEALLTTVESVGDYQILVAQLEDVDPESLKTAAERLLQNCIMVLCWDQFLKLESKFSSRFQPRCIRKGYRRKCVIAKLCGGGGGGRPNLLKLVDAMPVTRSALERSYSVTVRFE